jgi:hypothetical protein
MFLRDLADLLAFAATPIFAMMALVTTILGGDTLLIFCGAAHGASLPGGMVPMYLLMSVFHAPPWMKLIGAGSTGMPTAIRAPTGNHDPR